ncbi:MAG: YggS family pyridoxal phosphate-dependent enzyme [Clostridia bacterium]|nr:YggS family pyridoxal phosphate-dependent enzyme [Clostridia bacterium]
MKTKLSDEYKQSIRENLDAVRKRMAEVNSDGREVVLLSATKTVDADAINYAINECGLTDIGENRVQELIAKYDDLDKENVNLHFIGTLQTNKVKYIIDKVCMIHSLDSVKLAAEIDRQAKKHGIVMDVLIEINIGREESKSGVMPEDFDGFVDQIACFENIRVRGIMVIGPICAQNDEYIEYFKKTYSFFLDILPKKIHNIYKPVLSMGMSDNFDLAIECGSNLVRVGSAIFGKRSYKANT